MSKLLVLQTHQLLGLYMPPPHHHRPSARSRSRCSSMPSTSTRMALAGPAQTEQPTGATPTSPIWICEDCRLQQPPHSQNSITTMCCQHVNARKRVVHLCADCLVMQWEHYQLLHRSRSGQSEDQAWENFRIWIYHFHTCS